MKDMKLAEKLVAYVGGSSNVKAISHCVTRVRFVLHDDSRVQKKELEELPDVLGLVVSGGQYQIVIGPQVKDVYQAVAELLGKEPKDDAEVTEKEKITLKSIGKNALDTLISCFVPAIPAIAGSGMIKVLAVLLSYTGILQNDSSSYIILNAIGDAVFHFLPFIVAYNAAKKMKVDVFLSIVLAGILLYPNLATLGDAGSTVSFFGIGMKIVDYSAQALPVIFAVWLLKYVDRFTERISPGIVKIFLRPMLSLLITAPIMLIIIGPAAAVVGEGFAVVCEIMNEWGWLAVGINAALFPVMVLTGTHNATIPLLVQMFATQGFDSVFLVGGLAANIAQAGAAAAVGVKTKNKGLRSTALSASVSALLGITEPALYGVNLRMKKPFIGMLIGALLSGCIMGMVKITAPTFVTPSVLTAAIFMGNVTNIALGILAVLSAFVIPFVITYILGFKDLEG